MHLIQSLGLLLYLMIGTMVPGDSAPCLVRDRIWKIFGHGTQTPPDNSPGTTQDPGLLGFVLIDSLVKSN